MRSRLKNFSFQQIIVPLRFCFFDKPMDNFDYKYLGYPMYNHGYQHDGQESQEHCRKLGIHFQKIHFQKYFMQK